MKNRRRNGGLIRWCSLAPLTVAVLLLGGCGGSSGGSGSGGPQAAPTASTTPQSRAEVDQKMVACLEKAGFSVTIGADGGMDIKSPDPKVTPRAALRACQEELQAQGAVPDPNAPQSRSDREKMYKFLLGVNDCMKRHGYPTAEPPSLDTYVDGDGLWHPYDGVFGGPPGSNGLSAAPKVDLATVQKECPDR